MFDLLDTLWNLLINFIKSFKPLVKAFKSLNEGVENHANSFKQESAFEAAKRQYKLDEKRVKWELKRIQQANPQPKQKEPA